MHEQIQKACDDHTEKCKRENISPIMQELKDISTKLNDFRVEIIKEIADMPNGLEKKFDDRYADKHTEGEVDGIKDNMKWIIRLIIGVLVLAVLNLIVNAGGK